MLRKLVHPNFNFPPKIIHVTPLPPLPPPSNNETTPKKKFFFIVGKMYSASGIRLILCFCALPSRSRKKNLNKSEIGEQIWVCCSYFYFICIATYIYSRFIFIVFINEGGALGIFCGKLKIRNHRHVYFQKCCDFTIVVE